MSDRPRRAWTEPTGAEASGIDRRSPQWWSAHWRRTAAVLAILVLLIGTHIPRLELGPPDDGPDKLLHFFAFGVVATLLRISSLGRSTLRTALIAGTLALLDEVTQELPGLNRSFDPLDLVADAGGIATALAWCRALSPTTRGSDDHLARQYRRLAALRLLLASPVNWIHVGTAGVLGALVGGTFLGVFGRNPVIGPVTMVVVGGLTGFVAGAVALVEAGRRFALARFDREHRCIRCLSVVPEGAGCSICGGDHLGPRPTKEVADRGMVLVTAGSVIGLAVVAVAAYVALLASVPGSSYPLPILRTVMTWYEGLEPSMSMAIDATFLGIAAAALVAWLRRRSAIRSESEGVRCLGCGHDLRGGSGDGELGRCSECGVEFRRVAAERMADSGAKGENDEP